ncbi:MAG TPA: hypothetical protein VIU11_02550 [Nakamurella sp.]
MFPHPLTDGAVGMATGQIGKHAGALDESHVPATAGDTMPERMCYMGFASVSTFAEQSCACQRAAMIPSIQGVPRRCRMSRDTHVGPLPFNAARLMTLPVLLAHDHDPRAWVDG